MTQPHATIIGAGIIGVSTAAFLQRAGYRVTIVDRLPPGEGCSFGNAGGIAFAEIMPNIHPRVFAKIPGWLLDPLGPLTIRWRYLPRALPWFLAAARTAMPARVKAVTAARAGLGLRVVSDFETLLKAAGHHNLMVYRESLRLFDNEQQFNSESEERAVKKSHGFECQTFTGDEAREMEPAIAKHISHGAFHGGWYFVKNPERVVTSIAEQVVRNGGEIIADDVVKIGVDGTQAKFLNLKSGRKIELDRLVICAGAYSHLLARQLGENILLEAERGYHMVLPNSGINLSRSLTYARTPAVATPMDMGLRLAGTAEFAGLESAPNWARADALWKIFKILLPGLNAPDAATTRWMGRRPSMPDSLPVIGPSKKAANVWYGFGHGHMGLTWGPSTGRLLGELMSGHRSNIDLTPFRVDRF